MSWKIASAIAETDARERANEEAAEGDEIARLTGRAAKLYVVETG